MLANSQIMYQSEAELGRGYLVGAYTGEKNYICPQHKNLLVALLTRAVKDYFSDSIYTKGARKSARIWLEDDAYDNASKPPPFTLVWVCNHLDLCPKLFRKTVCSGDESPIKETIFKLFNDRTWRTKRKVNAKKK